MASFDFIDFGNVGKAKTHFAHANGFHPKMYTKLIDDLGELSIQSMLFRPYNLQYQPKSLKNWSDLANDFIESVAAKNLNFEYGLGHSMGGIVTLLAAIKKPSLFKKIVLLDPVILPKKLALFACLPEKLRKKIIPVAKIAMKRRDIWNSKQEVYDHLRNKKAYKNLPEDVFQLFLEYGFKKNNAGKITLSYSKEWEAQVYTTPPYPWNYLKNVSCNIMIIRGENSDVLQTDGSWKTLTKTMKHIKFVEIKNAGHLVPLEKGPEIAPIIQDFIFN